MADRVVQIIIDVNDKTNNKLDGLKKSLLAIDAAAQRTRAKLAAIGNRAYTASIRLIDRVTQPGSRINSFLKNLTNKTYNISMRLNDAVFGKIRSLEASLMRIAGRAYTVAVNLKDNVSGKIKGIADGALMGVGGMGLGLMGGAGIGYGAVNAAQAYMGFEKQMSKVQAIAMLDKDSTEMQALVQQAKDLGAKTAWTSQEVGFAMEKQAMAGFSPELIQKVTPSMLNMASAVGADLASASDIVTDAMTALGIRGDEIYRDKNGNYVNAAEHFNDMFARLITSANTDAYQAGEALKYGAPTIGAMNAGKDIQTRMDAARDALVMIGLQANSGIKGSMAGTGLNTIFNRMASENRNAYYALEAAGVKVKDERGDLYQPMEIMRNLRSALVGGMDVGHLMDFAEELEGTKLHADTRRKLTSLIEQAQKNGGKLGSGDLLKMSSMLAGTEHMGKLLSILLNDSDALTEKLDNAHGAAEKMANIQLQNLAGDLTMLGSAWDAFQQGFFEGGAGDGLRNFVQSLTEVIQRANELFKDGIQVGDIGKLIADVVDRLKNKFMELDGIGSILAGGALMAAFVKIGRTIQRVIGYAGQLKGLQIGQMLGSGATGAKGGTVSAASQVGTMHVTAGVVNIAGRTGTGGVGGIGGTSTSTRTQTAMPTAIVTAQKNLASAQLARDNALAAAWASPGTLWRQQVLRREQANVAQAERALINARVAAYNEQIAQGKQAAALARSQRNANFMSGARGGAAFAAMFGALDFFNTKSMSAERAKEAADALNVAKAEYQELVRQGRPAEELAQHAADIQKLQAEQTQILQDNKSAERDALAGATVSVLGAAVGAGLGSIAGPLGTTIGGVIGGVIGDYLGHKATEIDTSSKPKFGEFAAATNLNKVSEEAKIEAGFHARRATGGRATTEATQSRIVATQDRARMVQEKSPMLNLYNQKLQKYLNELQYGTGAQNATQDYYRQRSQMLLSQEPAQVLANQQKGWDLLRDLFGFGGTAHAATLSEEQLLQQAQMERPLTIGEAIAQNTQPTPEMSQPESTPLDFSSITEQLYSDMESFTEGINELFSGIGESISETLTTSFEGVGETFSGFTDSITENLTSAFEGISEYFSEIGATFSENLSASFESVGETFNSLGTLISESLTTSFESAGEMFTGFGESLTLTLTTAQASAETSLLAIGTAFETTKSTVQTSWAEMPGFFEGIFSGLGGAASSAGAAIAAGLTAPIGSIIGAWQSAASQISSIISSISAQAAAMPSISNVGGGGGSAYAEGGFVNSPTQALIGEAGAEVVIPLSGSKRSRALDLFNKTAAILGEGASIPMSDFTADDIPELDNTFSGFTLDAPTPVAANSDKTSNSAEVSMGGINVTFNISGADNPQQIMETIKENLADLADKIAGQLGKTVLSSFNNMSLGH